MFAGYANHAAALNACQGNFEMLGTDDVEHQSSACREDANESRTWLSHDQVGYACLERVCA